MRVQGSSAGGQLAFAFILIGQCHTGVTCNLLNTAKHPEWSGGNWTVQNPGWSTAVAGDPASNTSEVYALNQLQGRGTDFTSIHVHLQEKGPCAQRLTRYQVPVFSDLLTGSDKRLLMMALDTTELPVAL